MNPIHGSTLPKNKIFGLVETRVHAALAMPATLAALGAIFQAFPVLCPCEPCLPRGELQAVPCGARSNTRLLPASASQPPPAGIRSVREYNTGMCLLVQEKKGPYIRTHLATPQEKNKHNGSTTPTDAFFRSCPDEQPPAQAGLPSCVCTLAHAPTSRSGAETAQGGAPPNPTLMRFICVLLLVRLYVAATAVVVLLLRLI